MFKEIRMVCFDVDGTLTDGIYQISESGEVTKSFCTKDFYAIEQLMRGGIKVLIITQSHGNVINRQIERICSHSDFWTHSYAKFDLEVVTCVNNKEDFINCRIDDLDYSWENIAYMGDAEGDYSCIAKAVFSGCPTDGVPHVRDIAMYPSDYRGGHGAVHDFCMYLLEQRIKEDQESKDENS